MKNFLYNATMVLVGLFIGSYVGGCIADQEKARRDLLIRLEKLEQQK
jgi:hypothetical protein